MLLVLGSSFFLGGLKHKTQRFNADGVMMNAGLLLLSCAALCLPAARASRPPIAQPTLQP